MIVVLADDFSGAAELAGIAAANGFTAEVQTKFQPDTPAEVVAVDTDTRLKSELEAIRITREVTQRVVATNPDWIFKKTDSVLRGHVRAEIETMLAVTAQMECCLIAANPAKGRVIRDGLYWIAGVPLHETLFAQDPDHPRRTSVVRELLGESSQIRIPDVGSSDDLPREVDRKILPAGGAEFFAALLGCRAAVRCSSPVTRGLLVCGSPTAVRTGRVAEMQSLGFRIETADVALSPAIWNEISRLMILPERNADPTDLRVLEPLIAAAAKLISPGDDLHIGLEGGATAKAFIERMGWTRFAVLPAGHVGVGTLRSPTGVTLMVKPGSYPWPAKCWE